MATDDNKTKATEKTSTDAADGWADKVRVMDGPPAARGDLLAPAPAPMTVDAARVASETQAMVVMARAKPRNYLEVLRAIRVACSRPRFAEHATFRFPRGKTHVSGPSIRLMEALVAAYTNVDAGWRVLETEHNRARVEAYAWDLEANVRKRIEFWVRLARDVGDKVVDVTSERDKYEVVASAAQRRVRACIQNLLPFDLIDEALEVCAKTMTEGDGAKPLRDRVADMVLAFEDLGVNQAMVEALLGHPVEATITSEFPRLREIYNALQEGHGRREDYFDLTLAGQRPAALAAAPVPSTRTQPETPVPSTRTQPAGKEAPTTAAPPASPATAEPAAPPAAASAGGGQPAAQPAPEAVPSPSPAPGPEAAQTVKEEPQAPPLPPEEVAKMCKTFVSRLRKTYKLTDEQIRERLGGPIEGAPMEELERVTREEDERIAARRRADRGEFSGTEGQATFQLSPPARGNNDF